MSMHRSFLAFRSTGRHRNVLSRYERLLRLQQDKGWKIEENSVFGLPKVGNRKLVAKKKEKKADDAAAETAAATPEAAATPAAAAPAGDKKAKTEKAKK